MTVITLTIDGQLVSARQDETILLAARSAGIHIPTLCYLDGLSAHGGCRLCLVEIEGVGRLQPACFMRLPRAWSSAPTPTACASTGG